MIRSSVVVHILGMTVFATVIAGCLELATTTESSSSSSSTSSSSSSSSATSSSSSSTSTSSSSSSSSSGKMVDIIFKSDTGETLDNSSSAVICGFSTSTRPVGGDGSVLLCTHVDEVNGDFQQGTGISLVQDETYTFSFFFKNSTFKSPFDQVASTIGVKFIGVSQVDETGGSLVTTDPYPNGWYRQKLTFKPSQSQSYLAVFSQNLKRVPGGEYRLYGFQLERGYNATAYIP